MNLEPIKGKVVVRPSVSSYRGLIAVPDSYKPAVATCLVVSASKDVHFMIKPGTVVFIEQTFLSKYKPLNEHGDILCKESNVTGVFTNGKLIPLGNTVLFERDIANKETNGIIESISLFQYQSLFGWVRGFGIPKKHSKKLVPEININSYCRLTQWKEEHREIHLNGKFCLIVSPNDLLYEVCQD